MSWQQPGSRVHRTLLTPPDDGIAQSNHPSGWLARRLRSLVDGASPSGKDRVLRGRNYARRGRARDLLLLPGSASAEVWCDDTYRPTLTVAPLPAGAWRTVVDALADDLSALAALIEGDLPEGLVDRLEGLGVSLVPTPEDLHGDCDCGDWASPCTHVATLLHLLADALDGDPFLLLTLRGRTREDLLATLRARWGDDAPIEDVHHATEEPLPPGDPFTSPTGLPVLRSEGAVDGSAAAGLRALGPPPGQVDLLATLAPLYEAGVVRAREVLESVPDREPPRRRPRPVVVEAPDPQAVPADPPASPPSQAAPAFDPPAPRVSPSRGSEASDAPPVVDLHLAADPTGALIGVLEASDGRTSAELAALLGWSVSAVRQELLACEELGYVMRADSDGPARWWLG